MQGKILVTIEQLPIISAGSPIYIEPHFPSQSLVTYTKETARVYY